MVVKGTIHNGRVVPAEPLALPEGHPVYIVSGEQPTPQARRDAIRRVRARAVPVALPNDALSTESLYED